ncbi:hypothetical protein NDU88_006756 [Pleurodeles waltl]|uniref:Reverse transcriptase domain-containing protein n=1 Tax=Pleurodeles waltl TaxID=8319 RepID=A0AAV7WZ57_PLEWA|nr:hypothetical protein NDU88_006756 [Pleurodeles waltl]
MLELRKSRRAASCVPLRGIPGRVSTSRVAAAKPAEKLLEVEDSGAIRVTEEEGAGVESPVRQNVRGPSFPQKRSQVARREKVDTLILQLMGSCGNGVKRKSHGRPPGTLGSEDGRSTKKINKIKNKPSTVHRCVPEKAIRDAVRQLQKANAADSYKAYGETIVPAMSHLFSEIFDEFLPLPASWNESTISLDLKPGKSTKRCDAYRPVSLLNSDYKLFAKILADRLSSTIDELIHPDQQGFMLNRYLYELTFNEVGTADLATPFQEPLVVIALDAMKAFDRVSWNYLNTILKGHELGEKCCRAIGSIYRSPSAKVLVNGRLTASFGITSFAEGFGKVLGYQVNTEKWR